MLGQDASYHRKERASGTFQRSLTLPGKVDAEQVKATYKDGVLTILLKKRTGRDAEANRHYLGVTKGKGGVHHG